MGAALKAPILPPVADNPGQPMAIPDDPPEFDNIPGVPRREVIDQVAASLRPEERVAFDELKIGMAIQLGSHAAARVWLSNPVPGFKSTPLEAIQAGQVMSVLAAQREQWSACPPLVESPATGYSGIGDAIQLKNSFTGQTICLIGHAQGTGTQKGEELVHLTQPVNFEMFQRIADFLEKKKVRKAFDHHDYDKVQRIADRKFG